jgi:hypothetical protein
MVDLIAFGRPDSFVISPKVYKRMFKATYHTFGTLTAPATVTRSMGLPADARAVKFFAATLFNSVPSIGTCKKLASPDTDGN